MKETSSDESSNEEINKSDEEENNNNLNESYERISLDNLLKLNLVFEKGLSKGRVGLVNIGNTCFMNSALQCLSNCYELTKYFLLGLYKNDINEDNRLGSGGKIAEIYNQLLKDLWIGDEDYINPSYFKRIFAHFVIKFSGYHQQDSNEFLIFLLDKLHEDLNSVTNKPYIEIGEKGENETDEEASKRWWEKNLLRENSIIVDLFYGQFKSTITCGKCKRVSVSFDPYMFLSLPIPSGRFEINVKYFGYSLNDFFETSIPITENTTVQNIIDVIKMKLSVKNKKGVSNPPNKKKDRKKKQRNNRNKLRGEENDLDDDSVEIVLFTKYNKLYKVFDSNDYIFPFIKKGYELVAYEKNGKKDGNNESKRENIYFYLTKYYSNYFLSIFYNPKTLLFNYPLAISLDKNCKIFSIYSSIKKYLTELTPIDDENDKKEVLLEINNFDFKSINKQNEKNIRFLIYLNLFLTKKNKSICESIFGSSKYINSRLLDYCSSVNDSIYDLKSNFNLKSNDRICLDINLLFDIDETKFDNLSNDSQNISMSYSNNINLYDCLNLFNSEEILEGDNQWYCNKCKKHQDVTKKMDIYKSPYYLIIQLKRFKQDEMGQRSIFNIFNSSKNNTFIDFPTHNLDISKYLLSNESGGKYDLIGVINHYGGESFGHYTAFCLNNNKWCQYNDESVSLINESNVISSAAYVLFYKRNNH